VFLRKINNQSNFFFERETIFDVMFLIESLTLPLLAFFAILINKNNTAVFYYLSLSLEVSSLSLQVISLTLSPRLLIFLWLGFSQEFLILKLEYY